MESVNIAWIMLVSWSVVLPMKTMLDLAPNRNTEIKSENCTWILYVSKSDPMHGKTQEEKHGIHQNSIESWVPQYKSPQMYTIAGKSIKTREQLIEQPDNILWDFSHSVTVVFKSWSCRSIPFNMYFRLRVSGRNGLTIRSFLLT
jgi:hypothetical protein